MTEFNKILSKAFYKWKIEAHKIIVSSFVGLFWFTEDYSSFDEIGGCLEFSRADFIAKTTLYPKDPHRNFKSFPKVLPRGRVEVIDRKVIITVGTECPSSAVDMVKRYFGLMPYERFTEVVHNSFWDKV